MVKVEFVDPGYALPEPASEAAHFFQGSTREEFLNQLGDLSRRKKRRLFVATKDRQLLAFGLTRIHKVLSADGEVVLSGSCGRHRVSSNVRPLSTGSWYELSIDPASSDILAATPRKPQKTTAKLAKKVKIDPDSLPSVSRSRARDLFSKVQRQPHIPFQYPADGCWARAHEMARLIECFFEKKPVVAKIWNFGNLVVETDNNPSCEARWKYHVAPVVRTNNELLVIDPALFEEPVSVDDWRWRQRDCSREPSYTSLRAYNLAERRQFVEEEPGQAEEDLRLYRWQLISLIYTHGPLPYSCSAPSTTLDARLPRQ